MEDHFSEFFVERRPRATDSILKALLIFAVFVSGAASVLLGPVFMIGFVVLIILTWFLWSRFKVEYEYSYVNGQIDIAKIFSKQSRKDVARIDTAEAECIAPLNSHALDSYGQTYKVTDYSSANPDYKTWVIVRGGEKKEKVYVHLDDSMAEDLRRRLPRKVYME